MAIVNATHRFILSAISISITNVIRSCGITKNVSVIFFKCTNGRRTSITLKISVTSPTHFQLKRSRKPNTRNAPNVVNKTLPFGTRLVSSEQWEIKPITTSIATPYKPARKYSKANLFSFLNRKYTAATKPTASKIILINKIAL